MKFTPIQIKKAVLNKNYTWFSTDSEYNLNIVGIRNSTPDNKVTNLFDDWITLTYSVGGVIEYYEWPATTDPGKKSVLEYTNPHGVAILVPGQYRNSHMIGLHQGKYEALKQKGIVKVYRDKNKNMIYDYDAIQVGIFGINIHRSNKITESTYVDGWSAGCQVFKRAKDFNLFMKIVKKSAKIYGNNFTYTLLESNDLNYII